MAVDASRVVDGAERRPRHHDPRVNPPSLAFLPGLGPGLGLQARSGPPSPRAPWLGLARLPPGPGQHVWLTRCWSQAQPCRLCFINSLIVAISSNLSWCDWGGS